MRIFIPPIYISDEEGFGQNDLFGRKQIGDGLTSLLSKITDPMVIAVDGQWGSGKTTFLRMWAGELRKAGFPVVFFDSFEHDYLPDAFTAIAGQIVSIVEDKEKSGEPKAKEFLKKATGVGRIIFRGALKIGTKAATLGVLTSDDVEGVATDISKEIAKDLGEWEDKYLGELLTKQREELALIDSFKKALQELPSLLSTTENENGERPLIFIIDELDRCRPNFALEILERIKHFFSVQNIHFVLGLSIEQMSESVKLMYGAGIDAKTYLEKFIQIRVNIGIKKDYNADYISKRYINYLITQHELPNSFREKINYYREITTLIAEERQLSLRTLEQITSRWVLAVSAAPEFPGVLDMLVVGLSIIFLTEPQLYMALRRGVPAYSEVSSALCLNNEVESSLIERTRNVWKYALRQQLAEEPIRAIERSLFNYSLDRNTIIPTIVENVMETYAIS